MAGDYFKLLDMKDFAPVIELHYKCYILHYKSLDQEFHAPSGICTYSPC